MLKESLARLFGLLGLSVIPTWRLENREFALHLAELFERLGIDCVLDVGANRGQYRDFLRGHVGYTGQIVSFEPVGELARHATERARSDRLWTVYNYALGSAEATMPINVMRGDQLSSFLNPSDIDIKWADNLNQVVRQESVPVHRLDDVIESLVQDWPKRRVYLKIDTQGFEVEVGQGARKSLSQIAALQAELSVRALYNGMPDFMTGIKFFQSEGFDISGIFAVGRDELQRLIDFDCVMINSRMMKS